MQNQGTSAQTAAQQNYKCRYLQRQAPILAILMLAAVFYVDAQALQKLPTGSNKVEKIVSKIDTLKIIYYYADTIHYKDGNMKVQDRTVLYRFGWCIRTNKNTLDNCKPSPSEKDKALYGHYFTEDKIYDENWNNPYNVFLGYVVLK